MNLQRTAAIVLRQFYLISSNPTRFMQIFAWALLEVSLWGFITKYLSGIGGPQFHFVLTLLGAVILWEFMTRVMHAVSTAFFEDVWSRNFLNMFGSPIQISEYLLGLVLTSICSSFLSLMAMLILAWVAFGFSIFALGIVAVPFFLILFFFGIALGILSVGIVLRFGPSSEWFIWPIPVVLNLFVGVFYPIAELPQWMQYVSTILPPTYVFDSLRRVMAGGSFSGHSFLLGVALSLLYIVLAFLFFRSVYKGAIKSGLLARYSAESVE